MRTKMVTPNRDNKVHLQIVTNRYKKSSDKDDKNFNISKIHSFF